MASLRKTVKSILVVFLRCFSKKRTIVFESTPDFSDNTYAVYTQMVRLGYDKQYKLVWSCANKEHLPDDPDGVYYIYPQDKSIKQRLRNAYYLANAKCMICCNRFLLPWNSDQVCFYLAHGTPMKSVHDYYTVPASIGYCLSAAEGVEEMTAYQFNVAREKMFSLGYPRNDILTLSPAPVKEILGTPCKKVIVWYPTFRQHKNGANLASGKALPIIDDAQAACALNEYVRKLDVLLVLKPHFAQDLSYMKDLGLSNIRFIDDGFFRENNVTSYGFVAGCDALLTDYSSIYFDYMLCDKPIGLVWEDVEQYRQNPGFAVDLEEYGKAGVKIYTLSDFKLFVEQVAENIDACREDRRNLCQKVNYASDGENAKRVVAFIVEKAEL